MNRPAFHIALIKESCYQDLWVGFGSEEVSTLVRQTHLRLGPVGLLSDWEADFYCVSKNEERYAALMRQAQLNALSDLDYDHIRLRAGAQGRLSQTARRPIDYEVDLKDIPYGSYDAIICINYAVPLPRRRAHPGVTWICMPGEGKIPWLATGWDAYISHNCPKSSALQSNVIDMPYTFLTRQTFGKIEAERLVREGIYLEINSLSPEQRNDWRSNLNDLEKLESLGQVVKFHSDTTTGHLSDLGQCRYFVKLGGRRIRGNSFLEAMSAGLVCLMRPGDCYGSVELPAFCYFQSCDELVDKIRYLDSDSSFRAQIIEQQFNFLDRVEEAVLSQLQQAISRDKDGSRFDGPRSPLGAFKLALKRSVSESIFELIRLFSNIPGLAFLHGLPLLHVRPLLEV